MNKINISKNLFLINKGTENDTNLILDFLQKNNESHSFQFNWREEFHFRLNNWHNFLISNYIIVKNLNNEILAITSFWIPCKNKSLITTKVPTIYKATAPILNILPFLKMKKLVTENKKMEILYLNQFYFNAKINCNLNLKNKIFKTVIKSLFNENFEMMSICEFEGEDLLKNDKSFIKHKINMTYYTVHLKNNYEKGNFLRDDLELNAPPAFEMALV